MRRGKLEIRTAEAPLVCPCWAGAAGCKGVAKHLVYGLDFEALGGGGKNKKEGRKEGVLLSGKPTNPQYMYILF